LISVTISGDARSRLPVTDLRIFRDFAGKTLLARSDLECGPSTDGLPLCSAATFEAV
jgi:hypothetical protein